MPQQAGKNRLIICSWICNLGRMRCGQFAPILCGIRWGGPNEVDGFTCKMAYSCVVSTLLVAVS